MIISLQYGRALGAVLVVISHMMLYPPIGGSGGDSFGSLGVHLFFVISGFIMWLTSADLDFKEFFVKRISRIVPAYWLFTGVLIFIAVFIPKLAQNIDVSPKGAVLSLLFIPYYDRFEGINPILKQGWTLNFEMFFYFVFGLSLFLRQEVRFRAVVYCFVVLSIVGMLIEYENAIIETYTSTNLLEFVFGMVIARFYRIRQVSQLESVALLVLGCAGMVATAFFETPVEARFFFYGGPCALLICGALGFENALRRKPLPIMKALGDSSYSLYLSHTFVLSTVSAIVGRLTFFDETMKAIAFVGIGLTACAVFAYLSYQFFERPAAKIVSNIGMKYVVRVSPA